MRAVALSAMRLASSWLFSAQSYFDLFEEGGGDELGLEIYHTNDAHHMNIYINSSYTPYFKSARSLLTGT